mmetsp:Transcript_32364/g.96388  ORF Transcript_32364/g.96388 Transcript_32364/m.96388 type:complete len:231 (-) Transcript_32364:84-776(-)
MRNLWGSREVLDGKGYVGQQLCGRVCRLFETLDQQWNRIQTLQSHATVFEICDSGHQRCRVRHQVSEIGRCIVRIWELQDGNHIGDHFVLEQLGAQDSVGQRSGKREVRLCSGCNGVRALIPARRRSKADQTIQVRRSKLYACQCRVEACRERRCGLSLQCGWCLLSQQPEQFWQSASANARTALRLRRDTGYCRARVLGGGCPLGRIGCVLPFAIAGNAEQMNEGRRQL